MTTMPFGKPRECSCLECGAVFMYGKKLSEHVKKVHRMSPEVYCVKHTYAGIVPACPVCGDLPRFVSMTEGYKTYCKDHKTVAEKEGGKIGGKKKRTWNKDQTKESDRRLAAQSDKMSGAGNPFYGKHHTPEAIEKNRAAHTLSTVILQERFDDRISEWDCQISVDDYTSRQQQYIPFKCKACNTVSEMTLQAFERGSLCRTCFPNASQPQLDIADFVKSLNVGDVEISTRKVIPPLELDVWVPAKRVAVEYHGLYWHSGGKMGTFEKKRHRQKYEVCRDAGIRLIQFFSDEWRDHTDTCKSMLRNALGCSTNKLHARDCTVVALSRQDSRTFVAAHHISGAANATHHFGLIHKTQGLVGVATTRTPIQKKYGHVAELARMCFAHDTSVRGGASKLLKRVVDVVKADGFAGLMSYAELRYGEGGVYDKCGFTLVAETLNNYAYTDGFQRFNRFKYRAQPGKSEKEVIAAAGVRAVWGSGNKVYLLKF